MSCNKINTQQIDYDLQLPAGLSVKLQGSVPNVLQLVEPILMPFKPLFLIIDVFAKLKAVLDAVPSIITDPVDFLDAVIEFAKALAKLSGFIPVFAIPNLIISVVGLLKAVLTQIINDLETLVTWNIETDNLGLEYLDEEQQECLKSIPDDTMNFYLDNLGVINNIIQTLNDLADIIGIDLSDFGLSGTIDLSDLTDIDKIITELKAFIAGIPG